MTTATATTIILNTYDCRGELANSRTVGTCSGRPCSADLVDIVAPHVSALTSWSYELITRSPSGSVRSFPKVIDEALDRTRR